MFSPSFSLLNINSVLILIIYYVPFQDLKNFGEKKLYREKGRDRIE